jgi:hypothetical protein
MVHILYLFSVHNTYTLYNIVPYDIQYQPRVQCTHHAYKWIHSMYYILLHPVVSSVLQLIILCIHRCIVGIT